MPSTREILDRNDLVYNVLPPRWVFGLPIGNGQIGGMVWVEDGTKVVITLDHVWAWDLREHPRNDPEKLRFDNLAERNGHLLRKDRLTDIEAGRLPTEAGFLTDILCSVDWSLSLPSKTHVGRFVIELDQKITGSARLCLWDAKAVINLHTEAGEVVRLEIRADARMPVIAVSHNCSDIIRDFRLERVASDDLIPHRPPGEVSPAWYRLPDCECGKSGEIRWLRQDIPHSPSLVLAFLPSDEQTFVTVQATHDGNDSVEAAVSALKQAASTPERHLTEHRTWWQRFWGRSNVQLPDAKIESLWYMGLYLLASSSREGGASVSLHGLWQPDSRMPPSLGLYIWDFYPQYWGIYGANHLELGTAYYEHFLLILPRLKEETVKFYGWDGVFVPGQMAIDGSWLLAPWPHVLFWPGTSAWIAQAFWQHYLYSGDEAFLRDKAYPFMRECMLFYQGFLKKGEDGKYHIYPTQSPETGGWGRDDTLSLSLLRNLISGLLEAVNIIGLNEPHREIWAEILDNLPDYHQGDSGLYLKEGAAYTRCHRHLSHLAPIYPVGDINIDGSTQELQLIERSLNTVVSKGYGIWVGWSFAWASIIAARAGRKQMAWWTLKQLADAYVSCNTFNLNLDWERNGIASDTDAYCQDGNMAAVAAVNEMLLQSWGGRIRVFPACPPHWRDCRFDGLLCEGGIEVSAVRSNGQTLAVHLASASVQQVRLLNPFEPRDGYLDGHRIQPDSNGDLVLDLKSGKGMWLTATAEIEPSDFDAFSVNKSAAMVNPYGLKYLDDAWFTENPDIPAVHPYFCDSFVKASPVHYVSIGVS
ncbi:MAG: hypothetical protein OXP71_00805 [Candidatus Poribacteria bacterium]|nr:hypothetical protein [Candidatus Poribacteria bacterium]